MRKNELINTLLNRVDAVLFDSHDFKSQWDEESSPYFDNNFKNKKFLIEVYCELEQNATGPNAIQFAEIIDDQIMFDTYIMSIPQIVIWDIDKQEQAAMYKGSNKLGHYILNQIHVKMNPGTNWKQANEWTNFRGDYYFTLEYYI